MTPRTVIVAFPQDWTIGHALDAQDELPVSRLPVYKGSIDHVTGFVLKSDLLLAQARGKRDEVLSDLRRDIRAVPHTASLSHLMDVLVSQREHIAVVVGDYGGTEGLATLEDLVETLLGLEIVDEVDTAIDMQRLARDRWEKRAELLGLTMTHSATGDSSIIAQASLHPTSEPDQDDGDNP